eukprot:3799613-Rhodomonas_salina.1
MPGGAKRVGQEGGREERWDEGRGARLLWGRTALCVQRSKCVARSMHGILKSEEQHRARQRHSAR